MKELLLGKVAEPMYVQVDNSGAVFIMSNDSVSDRTKHIDIRHRWISSFVPHQIYVGHVPTEENYSDIFTKNTTEATFTKHAKALMDVDRNTFTAEQNTLN